MVILLIGVSRRLIAEVVIVALMLILMLVDLGTNLMPGSHNLADLVTRVLFFGLIALWVYINGASLVEWEKKASAEDRRNDRGEPKTSTVQNPAVAPLATRIYRIE